MSCSMHNGHAAQYFFPFSLLLSFFLSFILSYVVCCDTPLRSLLRCAICNHRFFQINKTRFIFFSSPINLLNLSIHSPHLSTPRNIHTIHLLGDIVPHIPTLLQHPPDHLTDRTAGNISETYQKLRLSNFFELHQSITQSFACRVQSTSLQYSKTLNGNCVVSISPQTKQYKTKTETLMK